MSFRAAIVRGMAPPRKVLIHAGVWRRSETGGSRSKIRSAMRLASRLALILLLLALPLAAQELPAAARTDIDQAVTEILARTGTPSASVAVVKDGAIVYEHAYGNARLEPPVAATSRMRYSIGSISKQFTATAVLLLAEEGKLSLDDRVVRWLPELTRAKDGTIRQVLSMTSGDQDFWPQDYVMPIILQP